MRLIKRPVKRTPRKKLRAAASAVRREICGGRLLCRGAKCKIVAGIRGRAVASRGRGGRDIRLQCAEGSPKKGTRQSGISQWKGYSVADQRTRDQGRRINAGNKTVPPDMQKLVESSRLQGPAVGSLRTLAVRRRAPAKPEKYTWSKEEIVPPGSPRSSKLVTQIY